MPFVRVVSVTNKLIAEEDRRERVKPFEVQPVLLLSWVEEGKGEI